MSNTARHERPGTGLPRDAHGTALPAPDEIDVTTLRGRRAVRRWERTCAGDVLERLTWSRPDQVVLRGVPGAHGEEQFAAVTARQGDAVANRFAHALLAAGLAPGDVVLLVCENSVEAYLAKIGIAKAGMVAAPVNPGLAPDVLTALVERVEPRFTLVDAELWPRVSTVFADRGLAVGATVTIGGGPVAGAPSFGELVASHPADEPEVEVHGDDVYELLFTSGTTALPKAVMLSHQYAQTAGLNFALSLSRGLRHDTDLVLGTFLPVIYHVGDVIFPNAALLAGGAVVLGRRPVPADVAAAVARHRVSALWAGSPQFVGMLADELDRDPALDWTSVTTLFYGWGALAPALLDRLGARCAPGMVTVGIFGQTEAIACHRFWPSRWPDTHAATAPSVNYVGVPSGLLASDVVDETGAPIRGEPGEAVYRSPVMTAGYYRDPDATREAFRGGWFHSGDSALVDDDGLRIMVDRYKDVIKSGGENVASMRVEAVLHEHPAVAKAAVVGLPHPRWGEAVTAVVVPAPGTTPDPDEVIAFCRGRLAGFETPKAVLVVEALPETVGGKVLKYRLRAEHAGHFPA